MQSKFNDWFVEQHKSREYGGMEAHTDEELRAMIYAGRRAERVLARRELWDEKFQSALYAYSWLVREQGEN